MQLTVIRKEFNATATIGELFIDGKFHSYTLEDFVRPAGAAKVPGKTAIPAGRYKVALTASARFKRVLPLLLAVPQFEGVRIHPGNTSENTEGCILVGYTRVSEDFIGQSRAAFEALFSKLVACKDDIHITVQNK